MNDNYYRVADPQILLARRLGILAPSIGIDMDSLSFCGNLDLDNGRLRRFR